MTTPTPDPPAAPGSPAPPPPSATPPPPSASPPPAWGQPPLLGGPAHPPAPHQPAPPHPAYGYQQPRPTDGFAIAALVFGIIGGVLFALVFGVVALNRIKRSGANGRGMAIAGLILAGVWTVLWIVIVGVVFALGSLTAATFEPTPLASPTAAGTSSGDIELGDCVDEVGGAAVEDMTVVPCTAAHDGQSVAAFDLAEGTYPGDEAAASSAEEGCRNSFPDALNTRIDDGELTFYYLYPESESWDQGDRAVDCLVARDDLADLTETFPTG